MDSTFDFKDLFIFDLANNHQGKVEHGLKIVREIGRVAAANGVRAALKFQFRQLDTLIHPDHANNSANKHIPRFLSTRLSREEFARLAAAVRENGLLTMATPFDEESVEVLADMNIELVKIASCSAVDWPLIERVADCNKPVVVSTGGLTWKQIDDLASFFEHRRVHFALMHCMAIYPTPEDKLELNQIALMCRRYPGRVIGFSTHESPDELSAVQVAVAKGARILERHVGIATRTIKLNAYSSTPEQIDRWLRAAMKARAICGGPQREPATADELAALASLKRGVYARKTLKKGALITRDAVYFAMPGVAGQLESGNWKEEIFAAREIRRNEPLLLSALNIPAHPEKQVLLTAIHTAKAMLNEAHIALPTEFETEFSHHYGIARFPKTGAIFVTCVNRSYCKKLAIQLPGQRHPMHYHKQKEETFQVLHGVLNMKVEGRGRVLYPGDTQLIQQGVWHEFWTETGVIFEEVSTTHTGNDSYYEDKSINRNGVNRKTRVNQWGRYQI